MGAYLPMLSLESGAACAGDAIGAAPIAPTYAGNAYGAGLIAWDTHSWHEFGICTGQVRHSTSIARFCNERARWGFLCCERVRIPPRNLMAHTAYASSTVSACDHTSTRFNGAVDAIPRRHTGTTISGRRSSSALLWCMTPPRDSISDELESLVLRFARFAGRIAHDRGLHHEDIDELLQELRVRFWRARKEGLLDLSANYVRRAAISAALDIIRRRRVDRNVSLDDDEAGARPLATAVAGPAELLEQSELAQRVALAVDGLAPSRRAAVRMYLNGYRREEISELLKWSDAKTRNLVYRGLADLRAVLLAQGIGTRENAQ